MKTIGAEERLDAAPHGHPAWLVVIGKSGSVVRQVKEAKGCQS